jgi:hypothetical protein
VIDGLSIGGESLETTNRLMIVGSRTISLRSSFALDIASLLESMPATGNSI